MIRSFGLIRRNPLEFLSRIWATHGDVVQFPIPKPPSYMVASPEGAMQVLQSRHKRYGKRTVQYSRLSLVTGEGLLTADTEVWRDSRRLVQPAFHRETLRNVEAHARDAVSDMLDSWRDGDVVAIDEAMMSLALDIVGRALFGADLSGDSEELTSATVHALDEVVARARNPLLPPLAVPTPGNRRLVKSVSRLDRTVSALVEARRASRPAGREAHDMLDLLLDSYGELDDEVAEQRLRDEIVTFIVAGHETVASTLAWAWYLVGRNPGSGDALTDPTWSRAVVEEALRLYPPAWLITRNARQDDDVQGHHVPAGSLVILSPWLVHRHPDVWTSPELFDPGRFANGLSVEQRGAYLPFGAGPRLCIGRDFALWEATTVLSAMAERVRLEPVDSRPARPVPLVTVRPDEPILMRVRLG